MRPNADMFFKPQNTLYIFSDEHSREITGCYGHSIVKTPNIDRLAKRGTRFTNAYTNCPICVPARAALASGRYVHQTGHWDNAHAYNGAPGGWGQRLMDSGHQVTAIGKLHYESLESETGWNEQIDTLHIVDGEGDIAGCIRENMIERASVNRLAEQAGRGDSTYLRYDTSTAAHAVRWLQDEAPKHTDKPWTLFLGFVLPHFPLIAPPEYYDQYLDLPPPRMYDAGARPDHPVIQQIARSQAYDKYFTPEKVNIARTAYFGMVTYLDHCVGQVLDALDASGLTDTTRVVYTSDHGDNLGNRGLWGKSNMYQEAASIPLIVAGQDIPRGHVVDTPVSLVDSYQTMVQGAGLHLTDVETNELPGHSWLELANDETPTRTVLSEYHAASASTGIFMIRDAEWKYVHYVGERPQLFDLDADPFEEHDLAGDANHADVLERCEQKLRTIVNPEAVNEQAFADQAAMVERHGGRDVVLARGDFGYTPAPGETPSFD